MLRSLRRAVAPLLLAITLALTGCGDEQPDAATDEPGHESPTGSPDDDGEDGREPVGQVDYELVDMITETAAGGEAASGQAVALTDEAAVMEFAGQFTREEMGTQLLAVFNNTDVPEGQAMYAAVVAVGCDVPSGVYVTSTDSGLVITGQKVTSPLPECFAEMTTVAVVLVDEDDVN